MSIARVLATKVSVPSLLAAWEDQQVPAGQHRSTAVKRCWSVASWTWSMRQATVRQRRSAPSTCGGP